MEGLLLLMVLFEEVAEEVVAAVVVVPETAVADLGLTVGVGDTDEEGGGGGGGGSDGFSGPRLALPLKTAVEAAGVAGDAPKGRTF